MGLKDKYYVQHELISGSIMDVVWIPGRFVEIEKILQIDDYKNGWVSNQAFETSGKTEEEVDKKEVF
jgi:hypothetical protein